MSKYTLYVCVCVFILVEEVVSVPGVIVIVGLTVLLTVEWGRAVVPNEKE